MPGQYLLSKTVARAAAALAERKLEQLDAALATLTGKAQKLANSESFS
jgi:hypothetical protein